MVDTKDQSNAIVYWVGILFVDTVDIKDQSNAIVYWVAILFVDTVDIKDQSNAIVYWVAILLVDTVNTKIKARNFNAMFVNSVDINPLCSLSSIVQHQYWMNPLKSACLQCWQSACLQCWQSGWILWIWILWIWIRKAFHPVFEMFYSNLHACIDSVEISCFFALCLQ